MPQTDHRQKAEDFLRAHPARPHPFPLPGSAAPRGMITKAALLPFRVAEGAYEVCLMRPVGSKKELGDAKHEICKGTRMWRLPDGTWMDLKSEPYPTEGTAEDLLMTALREGSEEMGLPFEAIEALYDAGVQDFTSASTGVGKQMQLYFVRMTPEVRIVPDRAVVSGTEEVTWMGVEEAGRDARVRVDHRGILQRIAAVGFGV